MTRVRTNVGCISARKRWGGVLCPVLHVHAHVHAHAHVHVHVHALRLSGVGRCSLGVAYRAIPAGLPVFVFAKINSELWLALLSMLQRGYPDSNVTV